MYVFSSPGFKETFILCDAIGDHPSATESVLFPSMTDFGALRLL